MKIALGESARFLAHVTPRRVLADTDSRKAILEVNSGSGVSAHSPSEGWIRWNLSGLQTWQ